MRGSVLNADVLKETCNRDLKEICGCEKRLIKETCMRCSFSNAEVFEVWKDVSKDTSVCEK